jgi:hypothetical protein
MFSSTRQVRKVPTTDSASSPGQAFARKRYSRDSGSLIDRAGIGWTSRLDRFALSAGHLLFAAVTTAYIFVGIFLEERDLVEMFGDGYRRYKQRVSILSPWRYLTRG